MVAHARTLSRSDQLGVLSLCPDSTLAVYAFFVTSGYLITMSYERSRSDRQFAIKRVRRLLPAYATVVVAAAVVGTFLTSLSVLEYLTSPRVYAYLLANLSFLNFLQPSLPGVFEQNPFGPAVNGALWSIRSELACYATVPVVVWLVNRVGRGAGVGATVVALAAVSAGLLWVQQQTDSPVVPLLKQTGPDCGLCFAFGIGAWYVRAWLHGRWFVPMGLGALVLLAAGASFNPWVEIVARPAVLAVAVMFVGLRVPYLGNWGRFGDLSYGIYIYHFPVIQAVVAAGWFASAPYEALTASIGFTVALALASWHFVEAPWLHTDSHYIRSSAVGGAPAGAGGPGADAPDPALHPTGAARSGSVTPRSLRGPGC
jgi:peptidoglycan/LPS O-acetylase OafA/YrhL